MKHVVMDIVDGVFVVKPKGSELANWSIAESAEARTVLDTLGSEGGFNVIVDLREVRTLNSDIYGVFKNADGKFKSHDRRMILCNLSGDLRKHIIKLGFNFELAENVEEALGRLREHAPVAAKLKAH